MKTERMAALLICCVVAIVAAAAGTEVYRVTTAKELLNYPWNHFEAEVPGLVVRHIMWGVFTFAGVSLVLGIAAWLAYKGNVRPRIIKYVRIMTITACLIGVSAYCYSWVYMDYENAHSFAETDARALLYGPSVICFGIWLAYIVMVEIQSED